MPGLSYWVSMSLCSYFRQVGTVCTMSTCSLSMLCACGRWDPCFSSALLPPRPPSHWVCMVGLGEIRKSCFLWAYSLFRIVNTSALSFPSSRTRSAAWTWEASAIGWMTAVEPLCLPGFCGAMHYAVILFWVHVHATSLTIELHRFSDHHASFSWCSQGLEKGLSLTACVRRGLGPIWVIETMQGSGVLLSVELGALFLDHAFMLWLATLPWVVSFLGGSLLPGANRLYWVCVNKAEMGTLKTENEFIFLCVTICHSAGAPISISKSSLYLDTWIPQLFATMQEILSVSPSKVKNT